MITLRSRLFNYLSASLWVVPVLFVIAGAVLSFATIALDRALDYQAISISVIGTPTAVSAILATVASSMVSLTALVLTITMVVVQLAMGQFSPRIVQRILRDKPSQAAIGLFVATFVHSILSMREVVDNGDGTGSVPGIAVVTALVLVLVSIAVLVLYVHHIGRLLRVSSLIELVGKDTRRLIDNVYPDGESREDQSSRIIPARHSGVVTSIGYDDLVAEAVRTDSVLQLVPTVGEFVSAEDPLFEVAGNSAALDDERLRRAVVLDDERALENDVAYGFRMLVDITERSISESPFQDPTTAVQAIDRLYDLLRQLVGRDLPDGRHLDSSGNLRLTVRAMSWDAYVHLAFDEIRLAGAGSPQITRRLVAALKDLRSVAPPSRVAILDEELDLLRLSAKGQFTDPRDYSMALKPDREGIGEPSG